MKQCTKSNKPTDDNNQSCPEPEGEKKKNIKPIIIICVTLVVLIAAGVALFILKPWEKNNNTGETNAENKLSYTIETVDFSDGQGSCYEKIVFSGSFAGVDKINAFFEDDVKNKQESSGSQSVKYKFASVWNDGKRVSVVYNICGYEEYPYGYNFDLETGERLNIYNYFDDLSSDDVYDFLNRKFFALEVENDFTDSYKYFLLRNSIDREDSYNGLVNNFYADDNAIHFVTYDVLTFEDYYNMKKSYNSSFTYVTIPKSEFYDGVDKKEYKSEFESSKLTESQLEEIRRVIEEEDVSFSKTLEMGISSADKTAKKVADRYNLNLAYVGAIDNGYFFYADEAKYLSSGEIVIYFIFPEYDSFMEFDGGAALYAYGYFLEDVKDDAIAAVLAKYPEYSDRELFVELEDDGIYVYTQDNEAWFRVSYDFSSVE